MRATNQFNKSKKGQFGFEIVDIFSYLGYFIAVLIILIILILPSCLTGIDSDKAGEKLQEKTEAMAQLKADAQLASFLRTQIPGKAELFAKLDWLDKHKDLLRTSTFLDQTGTSPPEKVKLDIGQTKGFLNSHPEVYADNDYSEFISSLYSVYAANKNEKGNAKMAFKVVTTVLFIRGFSNGKKLDKNNDGYTYYLFPLSVDFQNSNPGELDKGSNYDLSIGITPSEMLPERKPAQSIQVVPLADSTLAEVRLDYYTEHSSWLPQP